MRNLNFNKDQGPRPFGFPTPTRGDILLEHLQHLIVSSPYPHFLSLASGNHLQNSLFSSPLATTLVGAPLC